MIGATSLTGNIAGESLKTIVVNKRDNDKTPCLRGIMTRSLRNAGLSFERAFEIATQIRNEIGGVKNISSEDLEERVCALLKKQGEEDALEQYLSLIHISEPTRRRDSSRMPSSA